MAEKYICVRESAYRKYNHDQAARAQLCTSKMILRSKYSYRLPFIQSSLISLLTSEIATLECVSFIFSDGIKYYSWKSELYDRVLDIDIVI